MNLMMTKIGIFIISFLLLGHAMANDQKLVYGYVEKVTLLDNNITLLAKFDTGAKTASLSAIHIQQIVENGKKYVRFRVPLKDHEVEFIAAYVKKVKIKARAEEDAQNDLMKRPVVKMQLQLGNKVRTILVNLTNRKRFKYPLLLGREAIIAFDGVVDPSLTFTFSA